MRKETQRTSSIPSPPETRRHEPLAITAFLQIIPVGERDVSTDKPEGTLFETPLTRRDMLGKMVTASIAVAGAGGLTTALSQQPALAASMHSGIQLNLATIAGNHQYEPQHWAPIWQKKTGVMVNTIPIDSTDLFQKELTDFVTHTGGYDIVLYQGNYLGTFAQGNFLEVLDPYIPRYHAQSLINDYIEPLGTMYTMWSGKRYGLLCDGDIHEYYYRKDAFADPALQKAFKAKYKRPLAPAKTWEEFTDIAQFFTGNSTAAAKYGIHYGDAEQGRRGRAYMWFADRFFGYGGRWFDHAGNPGIATPAGVKALQNMVVCTQKYSPPGAINFGFVEMENAWLLGSVAQLIQWTDGYKDAQGSPQSKIKGKVGAALMPGGHPLYAAGYAYGINRDSHHKDEAFQFIYFMTRPPQYFYNMLVGTGVMPSAYSTGHDLFLRKEMSDLRIVKAFDGDIQSRLANLHHARVDLNLPHGPELADALDSEVTQALAGKDPTQALRDAQGQWVQLIQKYFHSNRLPATFVRNLG